VADRVLIWLNFDDISYIIVKYVLHNYEYDFNILIHEMLLMFDAKSDLRKKYL